MLVAQRQAPQYRFCRPSTVSSRSVINHSSSPDDGVGKPERGTTTSTTTTTTTTTAGGKDAAVDVNGNPVPPKTSNNVGSKATTPQRSAFPGLHDLKDLTDDAIEDHPSRDRDVPSASDTNSHNKSRRKKKEDGFQTAEKLYTNNCGNKTVDDLLEYIESDNSIKRKKDKSKVTTAVPNAVTSDKPVSKKPKKGRSSSLTENQKESENGSDKADDSSSKVSDASDIKDANCEALSEIGSVELNHKMPSMAPQLYNHDDEPMPEVFPFEINTSNYKFTDKEPISLNDTGFTEVRKKKKQRTAGALTTNHHYEPLHVSHESYNHRHTTPIRSITPPPKSSSRPEKHERAFSPSGFPELGGSGRPREGRRNSTGNVPCATSLDDSDIESVKSLPTGTSNDLVPAGPIVSYAKIAAKPKQSGGSASAGGKPATEDYKAPATEEPQMARPELPTYAVTHSPQLPSLNDFPAPTVSCDSSSRSISTPKAPKVSSTVEKDLECKDPVMKTDCKECVTESRDVTPTPILCTNTGIFPNDNKFSLEFVGESHIELGEEHSYAHSSIAISRSCSAGSDEPACSAAQLDATSGGRDTPTASNNIDHSNKSAENNHKKKSTECSVIFMDVLAQSGIFAPVQKIDITFGFDDPCDVCNLPPCMEPAVYDKLQTITKLNGLVLPGGSHVSPELTFLGPETNIDLSRPVGEAVLPSPPMPASSPSSSFTGTAAEQGLAKPVCTSTVPARQYDPNFDCGKFMLEDAVFYIRREWDRLTELAQKHPNRVQYYSCD